MKSSRLLTKFFLPVSYGILVLCLSCIKDHNVPIGNLPESECLTTSGTPRLYPCEFAIEKLTFLGKDGAVVAEATKADEFVGLSRTNAKTDSNPGASSVGAWGTTTYDVKMKLKRIANPSFPVVEGYILSATSNSSREGILHTPGERFNIGSPVSIDMPVGETREITFGITVVYQLAVVGGVVRPTGSGTFTKIFFVENDNTTLQFDRTTTPYFYVGSVVEDYIRLNVLPAP